jgi:hypothetical protein
MAKKLGTIEKKRQFLQKAYAYYLKNIATPTAHLPTSKNVMLIIDVISAIKTDQWTFLELTQEYYKHIGDYAPHGRLVWTLKALRKGGALSFVYTDRNIKNHTTFTFNDSTIKIEFVDIFKERQIGKMPSNEIIDKIAKKLAKECKLEALSGTLTIIVRKKPKKVQK